MDGVHTTEGIGVKEPMDIVKWQIDKSEELGVLFFNPFPCPEDDDSLKYLRDYADPKNIELELAPYEIFSAAGPNAGRAAAAIKEGNQKGQTDRR